MIKLEREGQRVYFTGDTYAIKDKIKALGGHWDGDSRRWWVGSKKLAEAESLVAGLTATASVAGEKPRPEPDNIRLTGKGNYKGKPYFIGASTRDGIRVRLLTLPDADGKYLDFWADRSEVELTKTYEARPERGSYGRPTGRMVYQTLGSIASFARRQSAAKAEGLPACAECGKRGHLHHDLEDGMMKCYGCCDIPE
jgi:hypothetical protein